MAKTEPPRPVLLPVVQDPLAVTIFAWCVMLFEIRLAMALVMNRRWWRPLLGTGIVFHLGIGVVHGLVSFGLAMAAALVIYLQPSDRPFGHVDLVGSVRRAVRVPRWNFHAQRTQSPLDPALR